ncbi:phBC6A51 family helix-turn-helix protein [Lacticaseibacillus sp. 866-1]|uniref:phBC6A51 family helix-turn-helix protein n=1 Tax=Lacticaseibacillus sp. 866-1 TaxID=2799576 RepID=UPI0019404FD2|nr:phBC6A51 family helix-turn-helix protein [Lacticaseibacillus sp. 866-1]
MNQSEHLKYFTRLPVKQQKAITLIFEGTMSLKDIAKTVNVSRTTLYKWSKRDDFDTAQGEFAAYMLAQSSYQSVRTLTKLMHSKSEMMQFKAAAYVLDHSGLGQQATTNTTPPELAAMDWADLVREAETLE